MPTRRREDDSHGDKCAELYRELAVARQEPHWGEMECSSRSETNGTTVNAAINDLEKGQFG